MKASIRIKLFIGILALILFFVLCSWVLNTRLLTPYYMSRKKEKLIEAGVVIEGIFRDDSPVELLGIEKIERTEGFHVTILSSNYEIVYDSFISRQNIIRAGSESILEQEPGKVLSFKTFPAEAQRLRNGESTFIEKKDPRLNTIFLDYILLLDNGDYLVISTPIASLRESAGIANQFFMITGVITIIIGACIAFSFAKRFTKPILELNSIAQSMSKLDFSKKYTRAACDEFGMLGRSINSLSNQLSSSISKLRTANEKLTADIERERTIDEMRKVFISNVSHELKTPIALIQGYAEGLKENVIKDDKSRNDYCDVIIDEAFKMNEHVKELLELSKIESGGFKLEMCSFNISSLVDRVLEKYRDFFNREGVFLKVEKQENITVNGDIIRIEQVLMNYISNAINYIDDKKIIKVNVDEKDKKIRMTVFNSGTSIPEESLERIWSSYYRVDKTSTRRYGGTGLGLSIVSAIMKRHNNKFGASNTEGGVAFWFELNPA